MISHQGSDHQLGRGPAQKTIMSLEIHTEKMIDQSEASKIDFSFRDFRCVKRDVGNVMLI